MSNSKISWKKEFEKISNTTKHGLEKLWDISLEIADKGSKQYKILKLQKENYFLNHRLNKVYTLLGEKVYKLSLKKKIGSRLIVDYIEKVEIIKKDILKREKKIVEIKKDEK